MKPLPMLAIRRCRTCCMALGRRCVIKHRTVSRSSRACREYTAVKP